MLLTQTVWNMNDFLKLYFQIWACMTLVIWSDDQWWWLLTNESHLTWAPGGDHVCGRSSETPVIITLQWHWDCVEYESKVWGRRWWWCCAIDWSSVRCWGPVISCRDQRHCDQRLQHVIRSGVCSEWLDHTNTTHTNICRLFTWLDDHHETTL